MTPSMSCPDASTSGSSPRSLRVALVIGPMLINLVLGLRRSRAADTKNSTVEEDVNVIASTSTVTNFCDAVGSLDAQPMVVSIGPVTSDAARGRGLRVDAEAAPHTIDGLVAALLDALRG